MLMNTLYGGAGRNCKPVSIPAVSSRWKDADDKTPLLGQEGDLGPKWEKKLSPNYLGFAAIHNNYGGGRIQKT